MKRQKIFDNPTIKLIFKILSWIVLAFLSLVAIFFVYYIISSKISEMKGQKSTPFISLYTIISPSMEPNINVYDVVFTVKVDDYSKIKEGDIITFISTSSLGEGLTVTHRVKDVIKTEDDIKFRTQGDNNSVPDSALASSKNVIGKVLFKIPQLGRIQFLLQSKGGWLFVLLIPALIIVLYDVFKVIRLSNVKQKVNESLKEPEQDIGLIEKQNNLKNNLKKKFFNVSSIDPIIHTINENDNDEENIIEEDEENTEKIVSMEDISNDEELNQKIDDYKKDDKNIETKDDKKEEIIDEPIIKEKKPKKVKKIKKLKDDDEIIKNKDILIKNAPLAKEDDIDIEDIVDNILDEDLELPKIKKD